jgi:hypothetical protein
MSRRKRSGTNQHARSQRGRPVAGRLLFLAAWLGLVAVVGGGSYFLVSKFAGLPGKVPGPSDTGRVAEQKPPTIDKDPPEPDDPPKKGENDLGDKTDEEPRREIERREAERKKQETERLAKEKAEKDWLDKLARDEERRKKEDLARQEAERLLALKRNPSLRASLEEIESMPDKYRRQYVRIDPVGIKLNAVDWHKDLARYTLGVTTEQGKYYSRVPLGGLIVSTSEKVARAMILYHDGTDNFYRFKFFGEIRSWQKKDSARSWPEVAVYRIEAYDRMGQLTKVLED